MMRGSAALVICPKVADEMFAFGPPKFGWLNALNASRAHVQRHVARRNLNCAADGQVHVEVAGAAQAVVAGVSERSDRVGRVKMRD